MKSTPKNKALQADLQAIIEPSPRLIWDPKTTQRIEIVRLPWYRVLRWKEEPNFRAEKRLFDAEVRSGYSRRMAALYNRLSEHDLVSFVRNTNHDHLSDLFIVASFGWWYVGIRVFTPSDSVSEVEPD